MLDTGIDLIFFICNIYNNDLMHIWFPYTYCTVLERQMWQPATGHPRKSLTKRPRRPFPCLHPVFQAANGKFNGYPDFMVLNHVSLDLMRFNATQVTQWTCGWSGFCWWKSWAGQQKPRFSHEYLGMSGVKCPLITPIRWIRWWRPRNMIRKLSN